MTGSLPYGSARSDQQIILALALKQPPTGLAEHHLRDQRLKILLVECWDLDPARRPSAAKCLFYIPKPKIIEPKLPRTRFNSSRGSGQHFPQSNRSPLFASDGTSVSGTSFLALAEPSSKVLPPIPEAPEVVEAVSTPALPHFGYPDHSRLEVFPTSGLLGEHEPTSNNLNTAPAPPHRFKTLIQMPVDPSAAQPTPYFTESLAGSAPQKAANSPLGPFGRADSSRVGITSETGVTRRQRPSLPAGDRWVLLPAPENGIGIPWTLGDPLQAPDNITGIPWTFDDPLDLPPIANTATAPRKSSAPKTPIRGIFSPILDIFARR